MLRERPEHGEGWALMAIPDRDSLAVLEGNDDREVRAGIVDGRLLVYVYERFEYFDGTGERGWYRDQEQGVALSPSGLAALRALLAVRPVTIRYPAPAASIDGPGAAEAHFAALEEQAAWELVSFAEACDRGEHGGAELTLDFGKTWTAFDPLAYMRPIDLARAWYRVRAVRP